MDSIVNMLQVGLYICVCHSNGTEDFVTLFSFACCRGGTANSCSWTYGWRSEGSEKRRKI